MEISDERIEAGMRKLDQMTRQSLLSAPIFSSYHHPNQNLTSLDLQLPVISPIHIQYLTTYSPPHLDTLILLIWSMDLHTWLDQVGKP